MQGRNIRFVHLPRTLDPAQAIEQQVGAQTVQCMQPFGGPRVLMSLLCRLSSPASVHTCPYLPMTPAAPKAGEAAG